MGLFLLWLGTSCWQEQPSKFTVAVTLLLPLFKVLQLQRALRKPNAGPHGRLAAHREENEPCLSWQTLPLSGNFCCLCRKASGGGSGGAAVILRAGWAFSTSPPFQETHFAVSFLRVCKRREGVEAKGHGAAATERKSSAVRGWALMCSLITRTSYLRTLGCWSFLHMIWTKSVWINLFIFSHQHCRDSVIRRQ